MLNDRTTAALVAAGVLALGSAIAASSPAIVGELLIFSADGAAGFAGRAGPLSDPLDQALLRGLRGFADVVLVGAGTVRA